MDEDRNVGPEVVDLFKAADVVDMGMGQHNFYWREVIIRDVIEHHGRFKTTVDDPAFFGILGMDHKAVGLPVTKGEGFDDHFILGARD